MEDKVCCGCEAIITEHEGHRSPWDSVPCFSGDTHLRSGDPLCSECYLYIWAKVREAIRGCLKNVKGTERGKLAPHMDDKFLAPDIEALFRKVVGHG